MAIRLNTNDLVTLEVSALNGFPCVSGHLLRFSIKAHMVAVSNGGITFSYPWARVYCGNSVYVGRANAEAPIHIHGQSYPQDTHFMLELPLSAEMLQGLERHRNGGDMDFAMDMYGTVTNTGRSDSGHDRVRATIKQGDWVKALEEMGYGTSIIFELPISLSQTPGAKSIAAALKSARSHLYDGNYRAVVSDCRVMLEAAKPDDTELRKAKDDYKEDKEKLSKRQRELMIFGALFDYASLTHHVTSDGHYQEYTRHEAILALGTTLGVLSAMAEKKAATPSG